MARKFARLLLSLLGVALGPVIVMLADQICQSFGLLGMGTVLIMWAYILIYVLSGITTGIILYFTSPRIIDGFMKMLKAIEAKFATMPLSEALLRVAGLIIGLLIALLLSTLTATLPLGWLSVIINIVLYIGLAYVGWAVAGMRHTEVNTVGLFKKGRDKGITLGSSARPKVLDTSVIIDGRILDVCKTGIIEGRIIVPHFVLNELRHVADSSDALKRNRGRRGLDILKAIQEELSQDIEISDIDYDEIPEVDAKLIRLAMDMGGMVVTNDYNLNKVAGVQNVPVFNINELANAVKPVVMPGEEMRVTIVREGKEQNQGLAFLDDGTMIVVENARNCVGEELSVTVKSVLQTSAGRMIFAKKSADA